ncbi:hypothetical protein ABT317_27635, partial [Streptomyces carpinensis]
MGVGLPAGAEEVAAGVEGAALVLRGLGALCEAAAFAPGVALGDVRPGSGAEAFGTAGREAAWDGVRLAPVEAASASTVGPVRPPSPRDAFPDESSAEKPAITAARDTTPAAPAATITRRERRAPRRSCTRRARRPPPPCSRPAYGSTPGDG